MYAHGITDASIGAGESVSFQNMSCRACDRSSTNIDVRHYFTTNAIYELPFGAGKPFAQNGVAAAVLGGWELAGIATARTGLPVNITVTRKASALLDGNNSGQRPNYVAGQDIYAADPTTTDWFNPAAFSMPASGTWGQPRTLHRQRPGRGGIRHLAATQVQTQREIQIRSARHGLQSRQSPDLFQPVGQFDFVQLRADRKCNQHGRNSAQGCLRGASSSCCARNSKHETRDRDRAARLLVRLVPFGASRSSCASREGGGLLARTP